MPKIKLGTAASRSMRDVSGLRMRRGAYSVMNNAAAIATGTAIVSAMIAITKVQ